MKITSLIVVSLQLLLVIFTISFIKPKAEEVMGHQNHTLHADIVTIVDETTDLSTPIASITSENYYPESRKWNGMPSVITAGKNIFVAWQTGGLKEPDDNKLNYIVIAVSQDEGLTWKDPFIIIDPVDEKDQVMVPQFYYNHKGQLYILFAGIRCIEFFNADSEDLSKISYGDVFNIGVGNSSFTKPTLLKNGEIIYASGTTNTYIFKSTDDGTSFKKIAEVYSNTPASSKDFAESTIIEKNDGSLWQLRRLTNGDNGGIEASISLDGGNTWSMGQSSLPEPLRSPGSRFAMQRLKSGNLLFITNAGGSGYTNRVLMTAYLSLDDGETWPYELLLDRAMSSYPDFTQDENGLIYAAFDTDRYGEGGMKICTFTEEDVINGSFSTSKAKQLVKIAKINNEYSDIIEIKSGFKDNLEFHVGTSLKEIIKGFSTSVVVGTNNDKEYTLTGSYRAYGDYDSTKPGTYKVMFSASLPSKLKDSFSKLIFNVVLVEEKENEDNNKTTTNQTNNDENTSKKEGCASSLSLSLFIIPVGLASILYFERKKLLLNK